NRLLIVPIEQRTFDEWFLFFLYEIRRFRLGSTFKGDVGKSKRLAQRGLQ
ncbi:hypothetical protein ACJX0J_016272, partial [Zea mays]